MIKVVVGNNVNSVEVTVEDTATLRSVLESNGVNLNGAIHLNGAVVTNIDATFRECGVVAMPGVQTKCFLFSVAKTSNAIA